MIADSWITSKMQFRRVLLKISKQLGASEVEEMKFLIGAFSNEPGFGELEKVKTGLDIFLLLIQRGYISEKNFSVLGKMLQDIGQVALACRLKELEDFLRPVDISATSGNGDTSKNTTLPTAENAHMPIEETKCLPDVWPGSVDIPKPLCSIEESSDLEIDSPDAPKSLRSDGDSIQLLISAPSEESLAAAAQQNRDANHVQVPQPGVQQAQLNGGMTDGGVYRHGIAPATPLPPACGRGNEDRPNLCHSPGSSDAANKFGKEALAVPHPGGTLQVFLTINQPCAGGVGQSCQRKQDWIEVKLRMNQE